MILLSLSFPLSADEIDQQQHELLALSLSDLMNLEVTSAAKKKQKLGDSAAAVFIITQEDIRRSGAQHLAEVLRMAPGLYVSRLNAYNWRVTSRGGFNGIYVDKVLIMIDGRSVYNLQFSNVFWDNLDMPLEDIERIEVIRGPGGPLWGANAVSGVVNIMTRDAEETQGALLSASAGDQNTYTVQGRFGGRLNKNSFFRAYAKARRYRSQQGVIVDDADDAVLNTGGFRMDGHPGDVHWTINGDAYHLDGGDLDWQTLAKRRQKVDGGHLLGRWSSRSNDGSEWHVQSYYDRQRRFAPAYGVTNEVWDIEGQYRTTWGAHEWNAGLGYRWMQSEVAAFSLVTREELMRRDQLFSAFVQDDIRLIPDQLNLLLGSKFEHNDYTGVEIQPTARLLWHPQEDYSFWAAVSRTVRTPSQVADHIRGELTPAAIFNPFQPLNMVFNFQGNSDVKSETVISYELGFRFRSHAYLNWDVTAFYDNYKNLAQRIDRGVPDLANGRVLVYGSFENQVKGHHYGLETVMNWQPSAHWQLKLSNTLLNSQMSVTPGVPYNPDDIENGTPHVQWSIQSYVDLSPDWGLNVDLRYVGDIQNTQAYWGLNVNLLWQINQQWDLSLSAQNLLDAQQQEYDTSSFSINLSENPRNVSAQLRWQY